MNSQTRTQSHRPQHLTVTEKYLIAKKIGRNWSELLHFLDLCETEKDDIADKDGIRRALEMISSWEQKNGNDATKDAMINFLQIINRKDIACELHNGLANQKHFEKIFDLLRENYKKWSIPQPPGIDQDLPIDEVFIDQDLEICDAVGGVVTTVVGIENIFEVVGKTSLKRILVEGDPGFGKTTLATKIAVDWANQKDYISKFKFVMCIPLRELKNQTLENSITSLWLRVNRVALTDDELNNYFDNEDVLLILDGVDEMNKGDSYKLHSILTKEKFPSACILVTSRRGLFTVRKSVKPNFLLHRLDDLEFWEKCKFWDRRLLLKGLSDVQRENFLKRNFKIDTCAMESKMKQIFAGITKEMFQCPLMVFWLGLLLQNGDTAEIQSKTSFYKSLLNLILHKTSVREGKLEENDKLDIFKENRSDLFSTFLRCKVVEFGKFCLKHLLEQTLFFTENELQQFSDSLLLKSDVFIKYKSVTLNQEQVLYQPLHKSLLEFLAAFAFCFPDGFSINKDLDCSSFKEEIKQLVQNGLVPSESTLFYMFVGGLLDQKAKVLFEALIPWCSIYNMGTAGMVNIIAEITEFTECLTSQVFPFFPQYYEISKSTRIPERYFLSAQHLKLLEGYLQSHAFTTIKWSLKVPFRFPKVQLRCKKLVLSLTGNDIEPSHLVFDNQVKCDELICVCGTNSTINESLWESFCSLILSVDAGQCHLYLSGCDSTTCMTILNDLKAGKLKLFPVQRFRIFNCSLRESEMEALTDLVQSNRIAKGIVLSFTDKNKCPPGTLHKLWNAITSSRSITEVFFSDASYSLPLRSSTLVEDDKTNPKFKYLGLEGKFDENYPLQHDLGQGSIPELRLRSFSNNSDSNSAVKFLQNFTYVKYLECPHSLLASASLDAFPVLKSLSELNLVVEESCFALPTYVSQIPTLQTLVLYLGLLSPELQELPPLLEKFLTSVLKHCNLKTLGLYFIPSEKLFSCFATFLADSCPKLESLELLAKLDDSDLCSVVHAMQPLKTLLENHQIKKLVVIDISITESVLCLLPSFFDEHKFKFSCELDGSEEHHSMNRQVNFKRWLVSDVRLVIELKKYTADYSNEDLPKPSWLRNTCVVL